MSSSDVATTEPRAALMQAGLRVGLATVVLLELLLWSISTAEPRDFTWAGLVITSFGAALLTELFRLTVTARLAVLAAIALDGLGAINGWYAQVPYYDAYMHAFGGLCIGMGAWTFARNNEPSSTSRDAQLHAWLIALGLVAMIGLAYEGLEYCVDKLQYDYPMSLVSAYNTIEDQACNVAGGFLGVFLARRGAAIK